jgi:hypothetical protein
MTQFAVGFLDSLFGEKLRIDLPGPNGAVRERTVTKKWFKKMQREQKIREVTEPVARAHVLSPAGYRIQHWVIGREIDRQQWERFRDADTGDLYVLLSFEAGEPRQHVLARQLWEEAKIQMDIVAPEEPEV